MVDKKSTIARERAMAALRQLEPVLKDPIDEGEEKRLRAALDLVSGGIFALRALRDDSGEVVDFEYALVNEAAAVMIGMPARKLQGTRFLKTIEDTAQREKFLRYKQVLEQNRPQEFEERVSNGEKTSVHRIKAKRFEDGLLLEMADITDEKHRLYAFQVERRRFNDLTENVPGCVYQFMRTRDGKYSFTYITQEVERMWGVPVPDVLQDAQTLFDRIFPEDLQGLVDSIEQSAAQGSVWMRNFRIKVGNRIKWITARSKPQMFQSGDIRWNGVMTDSTERRLSEIALQQSESRFRDLVDTIPGIVYQWYIRSNGQSGFYFVSPRVEEITGLTPRQVMDDPQLVRFHPEDETRRHDTLAKALSEKTDWVFTGRLLLPNERIMSFRTIARPRQISADETQLNGVLLDLAEGESAAASASQPAAPMTEAAMPARAPAGTDPRLLLEQAQVLIAQIDEAEGHWRYVTPAATALIGYRAEELLGHPVLDYIHPQDYPALREQFRHAREVGLQKALHFRIRHQNGNWVWLEGSLVPASDGLVLTAYDVTGREQIDRALQETNEQLAQQKIALEHATYRLEESRRAAEESRTVAESASRSKSDFLTLLSHELRTPLNAILGFAELMKRQMGVAAPKEDLPPTSNAAREHLADYLQGIREAGTHLQELMDDILDLSRIESGRFELKPEAIALAALVEQGIKMVLPCAAARRVRMRLEVLTPHPLLLADARAMRQLLLNLLTLTTEAMPEDSTVTTRVRRRTDGGMVIEIATDARPNRRMGLHDVAKNGASESTLGRLIAERLIAAHGGRLLMEETVGGSLCVLHFPAHRTLKE